MSCAMRNLSPAFADKKSFEETWWFGCERFGDKKRDRKTKLPLNQKNISCDSGNLRRKLFDKKSPFLSNKKVTPRAQADK